MKIEERENEFVISFPKKNYTLEELRDFFRYLEFRRVSQNAKPVSQGTIDDLAREANRDYWGKNQEKFDFLK